MAAGGGCRALPQDTPERLKTNLHAPSTKHLYRDDMSPAPLFMWSSTKVDRIAHRGRGATVTDTQCCVRQAERYWFGPAA